MGKMRVIHNLGRTEWWPLASIACVKVVKESDHWKVVVQFRLDGRWMAIHETNLQKDAQDWAEQLYK